MISESRLRAHASQVGIGIRFARKHRQTVTNYVQDWAQALVDQRESVDKAILDPWGWMRLREELDRLNRKAVELGLTVGVGYKVEREFIEKDASKPGKGWRKVEVAISGPIIRWEGWDLVGTVFPPDKSGQPNTIYRYQGNKAVAEEVFSSRQNRPIRCDHCRLSRHRVRTFILGHDDGRTVEVGSDCLRDFLGHDDPVVLAELAMGLCESRWREEATSPESSPQPVWSLETYLACVVEVVSQNQGEYAYDKHDGKWGYRGEPEPPLIQKGSWRVAWEMMEAGPMGDSGGPSPESEAVAKRIIPWARKLANRSKVRTQWGDWRDVLRWVKSGLTLEQAPAASFLVVSFQKDQPG